MFRLPAEEEAKLEKLIEFAHKMGSITKPSLQEFMVFAINCAYEHLKKEYTRHKTG